MEPSGDEAIDYNPDETHRAADRPYKGFKLANFKRCCQRIANLVLQYEEYGTGITKAWKGRLQLDSPPDNDDDIGAEYYQKGPTPDEGEEEDREQAEEAKQTASSNPEEAKLGVSCNKKENEATTKTNQKTQALTKTTVKKVRHAEASC